MKPSAKTLQGLTVLVTRPTGLADNLVSQIEKKGGAAILYPVISIEDADNTAQRDKLLNQLSCFDIAVFISPTSVKTTFEHIQKLPGNMQVAVIGSSTLKALTERGIEVSIIPQGHDSESLLQHVQLQPEQLTGKAIIIFRGQGGRELLSDTLVSRGASVSYAELYKRVRNDALPSLTSEQLKTIDIIAVTSNEGLQNLYDLVKDKGHLLSLPLLVPGTRSQQLAEKLGFSKIILADNATDDACIGALEKLVFNSPSKPH